jgi:hypothetical protein
MKPLVRKQNPFLKMFKTRNKADFSQESALKNIFRYIRLFAALAAIWLIVMLMISWYDPALHAIATFSSMFFVSTGRSWGVVEKIVH